MLTLLKIRGGIRCFHSVYGYGKIESSNGVKCHICFDDGFSDNFTIKYLIKSSGFKFLK